MIFEKLYSELQILIVAMQNLQTENYPQNRNPKRTNWCWFCLKQQNMRQYSILSVLIHLSICFYKGQHYIEKKLESACLNIRVSLSAQVGLSSSSRCSRSLMFFKIDILRNIIIFTGKHLYWSLALIMLHLFVKKRPQHRCFPANVTNILRTFLYNTSGGCFCSSPP